MLIKRLTSSSNIVCASMLTFKKFIKTLINCPIGVWFEKIGHKISQNVGFFWQKERKIFFSMN